MATDADPCRLCGHPRKDHSEWWDVPDSDSSPGGYCGFGCLTCGCDDFEPEEGP